MANYAVTNNLEDYVVGDRWIGISEITPTVNGETPTNDLTRVRANFSLGSNTYTLDSDDGDISIDDANGWSASIAARDSFLDISIDDANGWSASIAARDSFLTIPGKWSYDLEFWQQGYTSPWTLYTGTIVVHEDA